MRGIFNKIKRVFSKNYYDYDAEIEPDEIFLDSGNLPGFNIYQFEGRIEKAISKTSIILLGCFFLFIIVLFVDRFWNLQIKNGKMYSEISEDNHLNHLIIFAERGIIYDRNNVKLAWNTSDEDIEKDFLDREYLNIGGLSHLVGYISYPLKDKSNNYYQKNYIGKDGIEEYYDSKLNGESGLKIIEVNALSSVQSESVVRLPKNGSDLVLSVDSKVQSALYNTIKDLATKVGFGGGAGIIMDVNTGEILAITSYPEYDSNILASGKDKKTINSYVKDKNNFFLNRAISGLYTPGSIVKPFMSLAALNENIIDPNKKILSTGSISIPNPYFPGKDSVFTDWKAHGWVDMRDAIKVSSNVYFYEIGGGFKGQKGLGISKIEEYMNLFGFGKKTGFDISYEEEGIVPNPEWKKNNFDGEEWRIGDTYHTSIGQYGFQVTPIQAVRGIASVANGGRLLTPTIILNGELKEKAVELPIKKESFEVVKEGMRACAVDGTAKGVNVPFVEVAAKTGTAELGVSKSRVNSWVVGFFPYENPKYAFAIMMESGPRANLVGGTYVMRQVLEWMHVNTPEYLKSE